MMRAYLDDSGTHGSEYCFAAGYLARKERWEEFSQEWQKLRIKHLAGRPFKMVKAHRQKDIGYVPVPGLVEFADCIVKYAEVELWCAAPEYDARIIEQKYGRRFDPFYLCFIGLLESVVNDLDLNKAADIGEAIAWIFDHQSGSPEKRSGTEHVLIDAFNYIRVQLKGKQRRLLHSIQFADDEYTNPLQAADLLVSCPINS